MKKYHINITEKFWLKGRLFDPHLKGNTYYRIYYKIGKMIPEHGTCFPILNFEKCLYPPFNLEKTTISPISLCQLHVCVPTCDQGEDCSCVVEGKEKVHDLSSEWTHILDVLNLTFDTRVEMIMMMGPHSFLIFLPERIEWLLWTLIALPWTWIVNR